MVSKFTACVAGNAMRSLIHTFLIIVTMLGVSLFPARAATDYPLSDLVREVKVALLKVAEASEAQNLPKLQKAKL